MHWVLGIAPKSLGTVTDGTSTMTDGTEEGSRSARGTNVGRFRLRGGHATRLALEKSLQLLNVFRPVPRGLSLRHDLAHHLPGFSPRVVIDIGAHVGESALKFSQWFPGAHILCIEPSTSSYQQLQKNLAHLPLAHCFRVAIGQADEMTTLYVRGGTTNSLLPPDPAWAAEQQHRQEAIQMVTLCSFCSEQGIEEVDLVKVDTEGFDLNVLIGADDMLRSGRVGVLQVEAGLHPANTAHVPLESLKAHLEVRHYRLFGIYHQVGEFTEQRRYLRRCDAVFISRELASEHEAAGPTGRQIAAPWSN
jgi:FkbM family methyltransferase